MDTQTVAHNLMNLTETLRTQAKGLRNGSVNPEFTQEEASTMERTLDEVVELLEEILSQDN